MAGKEILKWLSGISLALACLCVGTAAYSDTAGHWAEASIERWSTSYEILNGYEDGTFRPDAFITRGAFAGILDRLMQFQTESDPSVFSDIVGNYWEREILKLHAAGVYLGNEGEALAGSSITRQQAVTMLGRAFRVTGAFEALPYRDTEQFASYARDYIGIFTERGWMEGNRTDCFRPTDAITRAEFVSILDHMIQVLVRENVTWTEDVDGTLMICSAEGALVSGAKITGDVILAPGTGGQVTLTDVELGGAIHNYSSIQPELVKTEAGPETGAVLTPTDVYTPTPVTGETFLHGSRTIPIYAGRERSVFQEDDFSWDGNGRLVYNGEFYRTRFGVDVSSYQADIDWEAVAADGVEFAMVRVGYRGTSTGSLNTDKYYRQNITGAMAAGLDTGVYFFAQAITIEEALEEADYVIALLDGLEISGPVCYDWEMNDSKYRVYGTAPEMATACAIAFCERVKAAGYTPMVYAGSYVSYVKYDQGALAPYLYWYPEYKSDQSESLCPAFRYTMNYWQYSSKGKVAGIQGNVDVNLQFIPLM